MTTNDKIIRKFLRLVLEEELKEYKKEKNLPAEIFEEFGVSHGTARIDFAIINGVMHGYEIKSDKDTLDRLPDQMREYNAVFDKMTLVVGRHHLYEALAIIPEWWGIILAKKTSDHQIIFHEIRADGKNPAQDGLSVARLLWRAEALKILEEKNEAAEIRSKPREIIYAKLAEVLKDDLDTLKDHVRNALLVSRGDWRSAAQPVLNGG